MTGPRESVPFEDCEGGADGVIIICCCNGGGYTLCFGCIIALELSIATPSCTTEIHSHSEFLIERTDFLHRRQVHYAQVVSVYNINITNNFNFIVN